MKTTEIFGSLVNYLCRHPSLLFFLWAMWLGAEYFCFGPNSYVRIHDNGDQFIPARLMLLQNLKSGAVGYWSFQWNCGTDLLEHGYVSDLGVIPFLLLPGWLAHAAVLVVQRFIAGYFTFRLLREDFRAATGAAIYAALTFALFAQNALNRDWAGFSLYHGFAIPAIPLILWALSRIDITSGIFAGLLSAVVGALLAVSANISYTPFVIPLAAFWFCFVASRRSFRFWLFFALFVTVWAVVTLVAVLPIIVNASLSNRESFDPTIVWSFRSRVLSTLVLLRSNFIPLALGTLGLMVGRWRERRLVAIGVAVCFCLAASGLSEATLRHFRAGLGFLHGFNWARFAYLIPFLAAAAAAIGISLLHDWCDGFAKSRSRWKASAATAILAVLIAVLSLQSIQVKLRTVREMVDGSNYRALYLNPELQQLEREHSGKLNLFRVATISLGNTDPPWPPNAAWAYGFSTADGYLNLQSVRYREFWEQVLEPLTQNDRGRYDWVHSWGNQLYLFSPTHGFPETAAGTSTPVVFSNYYRLNLLGLANVRYIISPVPLADPELAPVSSDFLKDQLAWRNRSVSQRLWDMFLQQSPGTALYVYENKQPLPRAFCAPAAQRFSVRERLYTALSQATNAGLESSAFFEAADVDGSTGNTNGEPGKIRSLQYSSDAVAVSVQTASPCALVLTDNYSPYWKAQLDGAPVRLSPADGTFQGLIIPAGNHQLNLRYAPPYSFH